MVSNFVEKLCEGPSKLMMFSRPFSFKKGWHNSKDSAIYSHEN